MEKAYSRINWKNGSRSTDTPLNETNMNLMDSAIDVIDGRVCQHDAQIQTLQGYETRAAQSAAEALQSAQDSEDSATDSANSASASSQSASASALSASSASASATSASQSASSASTSETNASQSEANALASEQNAKESEDNAKESEENAETYQNNALIYKDLTYGYKNEAESADMSAQQSASNASTSETSASASATLSQSYAVGGTNTRTGEDTDNAKYYKEQAQQIADNFNINNETPTFTQASTRANINSGETISTIMGKIKKFFADLKTVAFTGSYNDLTNKPEHLGHSIKDATTTFTDRASLKFTGNVSVSDDSTNDETIIDVEGKPDHFYATKEDMLDDISNIQDGEMAYTEEDASDLLTRVENIEQDVSDAQEDIEEINSNLSYKNLGTKLGTQFISLPDNWEKIHIVVAVESTDKITTDIIKDDVEGSSNEYFQSGYYLDSSHFCRVVVQVTTNNQITLTSCFYNSTTNVANQKYFAVKYR